MTSVLLSRGIPCLYRRLSSRVTSNVVGAFASTATTAQKPTPRKIAFPGYKPIYASTEISFVSALNSMKEKYITFCIVVTPLTYLAHFLELLNDAALIQFVMMCFAGMLFLQFSNSIGTGMIAFVYYKKEKDDVIISYVTEKGTREDLHVKLNDIVPLQFTDQKFWDAIYREVVITGQKQPLKLSVRAGKILDEKNFSHVFGDY